MKALSYIVISVVVISVIGGFFIIGSPATERVRRFDERRVSDLQTIQWEVINYWQKKNQLPATLGALRDDIRGFVPPQDPETGAPYEYAVSDATSFSLCAVFSMPTDSATDTRGITKPLSVGLQSENWAHNNGRACFKRVIDKDLYPPVLQAERGMPVPLKPAPVIE